MKLNILLTGASGFIGNAFLKELNQYRNISKHEIQIFYIRRPNQKRNILNAKPIDINSNSIESFKVALSSYSFDYIFNFASYGVNRSENNILESIDGNITFLVNLLLGINSKPSLFVNIGSCAEYGIVEYGKKVNESSITKPESLYATSKLSAYYYGLSVAKQKDIPFIHLRLFGVYGEGENKKRLLPYVTNNLLKRIKSNLTSGNQIRDWIYIDDVIDALIYFLEADLSEIQKFSIYNICSGKGHSVKKMLKTLCNELNASDDLLEWNKITRIDEPKWLVGDPSRFKSISGWEPKISLEQGIKNFVRFFESK